MKFLYALLSLLLAILFLAFLSANYMKKYSPINSPSVQDLKKDMPLRVKGSIPYWDQENAFTSVQKNPEVFNYLNLFWYFLGSDGEIYKYQYAKENPKIISFAHANNIKVFAVLTNLPEEKNTTWDSKRVEKVLSNPNFRQKHIGDILKKLIDLKFDGVTIDYESVNASQRNQFSIFIKELASTLKSRGKLVTVALHPKKGKQDEKASIGASQDWQALGQSADQLNIMAYGEHDDEGSPGPIASIPWLKEIINYAQSLKIPSEKIYLGVPVYGYDWNKDNDESATGLTYVDVLNLLEKQSVQAKWDEKSKSPYFTYKEDGSNHEVWFEDERSIEEKINLAKNAGLGGISLWHLGGEDPGIWEKIQNLKKN